MANKNSDNDEYHFTDLDGFNDNLLDENTTKAIPNTVESFEQSNNRKIRRNAVLVVVLIILAMLIYKFVGSFIPHKSSVDDVQLQSTQAVIAQPTVPSADATPVQQNDPSPNLSKDSNESSMASVNAVNQKLADIEISQQNITNDINNMTNQISGFNTIIDNLNTKLTNLNEAISALTTKVAQQSDKLAALTIVKQKPVIKTPISHSNAPVLRYYINAIIPGRAWLVATNGSTLTVREGSRVPGLGIIKLIDAGQGRVLTSSGKMIRFSQQDS
jgi:intracellular multiplication protein IcmG